MISEWTKNLRDPEAKSKFENQIYSAKAVLDRVNTLLDEQLKNLDRSETDISVFDSPNWAERQAFKNGQRKSLQDLKTLVSLDQQKDPKR